MTETAYSTDRAFHATTLFSTRADLLRRLWLAEQGSMLAWNRAAIDYEMKQPPIGSPEARGVLGLAGGLLVEWDPSLNEAAVRGEPWPRLHSHLCSVQRRWNGGHCTCGVGGSRG